MSDPPGAAPKRLFDRALEVALYLPLGAALRLAEQVPELAEAGRDVAGRQIDNARVIGRFAVGAARRQIEHRLSRPAHPADPVGEDLAEGPRPAEDAPPPPAPRRRPGRPRRPADEGSPDALAVPGYDALAASQVLPLLDGLSPSELEAVRRHEEAGRARRTVLGRIAQLQRERFDGRA